MDINALMQMANQLRGQLSDAQAEADKARHQGEAGGGLVRVVMNGRHELVEVMIDPKAVESSDLKLLEDLVRAAVNQASSQVASGLQTQLGSMAQGLGLDISSLMPKGGEPEK